MEGDAILGTIVIGFALFTMTSLILWSRRTIDWIAAKGRGSGREMLKEMERDR